MSRVSGVHTDYTGVIFFILVLKGWDAHQDIYIKYMYGQNR